MKLRAEGPKQGFNMEDIKQYFKGPYQDFEKGKSLYMRFGRDHILKKSLKRGVYTDKIYRDMIAGLRALIEKPRAGFTMMSEEEFLDKKRKEERALPARDPKRESGDLAGLEELEDKTPEAQISKLERENVSLYNQRAMLSNRLESTIGKNRKEAIISNLERLEAIEKTAGKMMENRRKINRLKAGEEDHKKPSDRRILIYTKDHNYTKEELAGLNYSELGALREICRGRINRAQRRIQKSEDQALIEKLTIEIETARAGIAFIDPLRKKRKNER